MAASPNAGAPKGRLAKHVNFTQVVAILDKNALFRVFASGSISKIYSKEVLKKIEILRVTVVL